MEPLVIPVAHDFTCPWCWVGLFQAKRLQVEFGAQIEWLGYELWPEELEWPESRPAGPVSASRPPTPSRFDFLKLMDGVEVPAIERPKRMRVHAAFEAVEYIKDLAPKAVDAFVEEVYRALWERGEHIGDIDVIVRLAEPYLVAAGPALSEVERVEQSQFRQALEDRRYRDKVVHFDAPSYKVGVFNVPTFFIGGQRYAEQPYVVLAEAVRAVRGPKVNTIYANLSFSPALSERPYTYVDMVATIDGKILSGGRDEPVIDLGSRFDHDLMKKIEGASDAVLIGAQTLRAAKKSWNPRTETRVVVTKSGDLPFDSRFFSCKPIIAIPGNSLRSKTLTPVPTDRSARRSSPQFAPLTGPLPPRHEHAGKARDGDESPPGDVEVLRFSDLPGLMKTLRTRGIEKLLVLGGSTLNAQLFERGLIDEIFLTIAPKIKLGADVPTIADGNPLPRESIQNYSIIERHQIGDELFLRYRRNS